MSGLFSNILKQDVSEPQINVQKEVVKDVKDYVNGETVEEMVNAHIEQMETKSVNAFKVDVPETTKVVETPVVTPTVSTPVGPKFDGAYELEDSPNVIDLENITLKFGDFTLFDKLNFSIPDFKGEGQFIAIMGGSGSGKTQMSRLISGLKTPNEGTVKMYGKPYDEKTYVPMVFQQYSSFPWMTVLENVALPLKMKGIGKEEREAKAMEVIKLVGLEGHETKWAQYPTLSGGQLQRVSLARNLVADSQIMILDEYSSGLDTASKATMQDILLKLFYDDKIDRTFIMITHDINEAIYLSQRVYLLDAKTHTFGDVIDVKFDGKRDRSIIGTQKYQEYYKRIEDFFKR